MTSSSSTTWQVDLDDPTVVVGIPTYNNAETIETTLEMLFGQTRVPDAIVICDNSQDRTRQLVEAKRTETEIDVICIEQDGDGVAAAYNQIWNYVKPDYDVFATIQTNLRIGDDWLEGHLQVHREHPVVGIVTALGNDVCREIYPDEQGYYTGRNVSFKQGVLEAIEGWDQNFLRGEDWDMQIRLAGVQVRSYRCSRLHYGWMQDGVAEDPYITLEKAKRRPYSVSFLSKYGPWYFRYHPTHVIHDLLSLGTVGFVVLGLLTLPFHVSVGLTVLGASGILTVAYLLGHAFIRGPVHGSYLLHPLRKLFLNGIGVFYAIQRVWGTSDWNLAGFNPENIPSYEL